MVFLNEQLNIFICQVINYRWIFIKFQIHYKFLLTSHKTKNWLKYKYSIIKFRWYFNYINYYNVVIINNWRQLQQQH
jgi:hypothetical protein